MKLDEICWNVKVWAVQKHLYLRIRKEHSNGYLILVFTCKNRLQYSRERASQSLEVIQKLSIHFFESLLRRDRRETMATRTTRTCAKGWRHAWTRPSESTRASRARSCRQRSGASKKASSERSLWPAVGGACMHQQTLRGSFSAVSKPTLATKELFSSIFRDLLHFHTSCTAPN